MKKYRIVLLAGLLLPALAMFWSFTTFQNAKHPILLNIIQKFEDYFSRLPQQKVYLHFDKSNYRADETVWFKAYLVNAGNHKPDSSTNNLYAELINPSGYIVQSKLIRMTNGFGNGDFSFQDTIPEGVYKVRAFTNWMRNLGEDFFFEKEFYVSNPDFSSYVTREELQIIKREKRKNLKKESRVDVQFLPEGGHLLAGIENKIGFKALNELGQGLPVSGFVFDSKGNEVIEIKSSDLGMGSFRFTPLAKEKYSAVLKAGDDKELKIKLPEAIAMGVTISVTHEVRDVVRIKVLNNFASGQFPANTAYYLLAHVRGEILYSHEFDLKNPVTEVDVNTSKFPSGIVHFSLFNMYSQAVSERLIFVNNQDQLRMNIEPSVNITSSREDLTLHLKVTDKNGIPVKGNFSVSIANSEDSQNENSILSELLLNSDLRGRIEQPDYYFSDQSPEKQKQLDDLMLTQGWTRISWTRVLSDTRIPPKYENERGIVITGKITKEFFGIPLRDIKVTLSIMNEFNDVFTARSGEKGKFRFESVDYQDTVSVTIEAVRASGRRNLLIFVDSKEDKEDKDMQYQTLQNLKRHGTLNQYETPEDPYKDDPLAEQNKRLYRLHEEPSGGNVIIIDERTQNYSSVGQILEGRVAGVMVTGNKVNIRGINSLYGNTDPLFLVDGIPVDADYALSMNPYDVERIEVLKGPETAIYGSRGANGVIAIYTKRGKFMKKGILEFKMLGYHTPKEYYNPKYEYRADDIFEDDRITILWMPYFITDSEGVGKTSFHTSDVKGNFTIRIEGLSEDGIPGYAMTGIEVK